MKYHSNFLERHIPRTDKNHDWPQILTILVSSLASLSYGFFFSWPSPSITILTSNASHIEPITLEEASYFPIISPISAALASLVAAILVDIIGRKKTVMLIVIPHLSAWILIVFAKNIYVLYLSRALSGTGDAIVFGVLPTYIAEIAQPHVRGTWGNLMAIAIYFGQFLVNVVGAYCSVRTTAIIFSIFPILHVSLTAFLPESPYFLLMKGKTHEAREALRILRWRENVDDEIISLTKDVNRQISESGTLKDLFTIRTNRKALLISIAIRITQQFSGLSAFSIYTQYMFNEAGGNISASTSAIIFSGTLFLAIGVFAFVIDKLGRKPSMTFSSLACGTILVIEATYFYISQNTSVDTSGMKWVPLAGMLVFILVCSLGLGIIPTLMLGELFSASIKSKALSVLNINLSICLVSVSKLFQLLTSNFGLYVPFYLFSISCFLGALFSYFWVPETKGKTLEEIQQELQGKPLKYPAVVQKV